GGVVQDHACRIGRRKVKVEPAPSALDTQILPPCSSMNFRHKVSPRPVPCCRAALEPTWRNSSKTASWSSGAIPIPVSLTDTSTPPSSRTARLDPPALGRELDGIGQKVEQDLPHLALVRSQLPDPAVHRGLKDDTAARGPLAHQGERILDRRRQVKV